MLNCAIPDFGKTMDKKDNDTNVKVLPKRNILKAITWRIIGALDLFIVSWIFTGDPTSGLKMGFADTVTKLFFYYLHERMWVNLDLNKYPKLRDSRRRHIYKTLTWRIFSSIITVLLGWIIIGNPFDGLKISAVESVIQLVLYYYHERAWHQSKFGLKIVKEEGNEK